MKKFLLRHKNIIIFFMIIAIFIFVVFYQYFIMFLPWNQHKAAAVAETYLETKYNKDFIYDHCWVSMEPFGYCVCFYSAENNDIGCGVDVGEDFKPWRDNYNESFVKYHSQIVLYDILSEINSDIESVSILMLAKPPRDNVNIDYNGAIEYLKNEKSGYCITVKFSDDYDKLKKESINKQIWNFIKTLEQNEYEPQCVDVEYNNAVINVWYPYELENYDQMCESLKIRNPDNHEDITDMYK